METNKTPTGCQDSRLVFLADSTQARLPVLTVSEVIALEKRLEARGTSLLDLMKRAGWSVSEYVVKRFEPLTPVAIFCGAGNNGGDGWVVAGNLALKGFPVVVVTPLPAHQLKAEPARSAALEVISMNPATLSILVNPTTEQLDTLLQASLVVIDALLGVGFRGDTINEPYQTWIEAINSARLRTSSLHVVAVDVPSGCSADDGTVAKSCIIADATITMLAYKPGLLLDSSQHYCGLLYLALIADEQTHCKA